MSYIKPLLLLATSLFLLTACSYYPKNIQDYRTNFYNPKSPLSQGYETYILKRSLKDVHKSLLLFIKKYKNNDSKLLDNYKVTLYEKSYRLELHFQEKANALTSMFQIDKPKDGVYKLLLDVYRNSEDSVKINFYKMSDSENEIMKILKELLATKK